MPTCLVVSKQPWSVTQQTRRGPCLALIAKPKYDYILKEENNEICPKWWQPGISLQKISHGNRTCQMSRCQPRPDNRGQSAPASSGYSGRRSETEERSGEIRRIRDCAGDGTDAGGYQEDAATQPPPPAQGYWRPAEAGAGLPADAEAGCCCWCAGLGRASNEPSRILKLYKPRRRPLLSHLRIYEDTLLTNLPVPFDLCHLPAP